MRPTVAHITFMFTCRCRCVRARASYACMCVCVRASVRVCVCTMRLIQFMQIYAMRKLNKPCVAAGRTRLTRPAPAQADCRVGATLRTPVHAPLGWVRGGGVGEWVAELKLVCKQHSLSRPRLRFISVCVICIRRHN